MQLTSSSLSLDTSATRPTGSAGGAATDLASLQGAAPTDGPFSALLGAVTAGTGAAPTPTAGNPMTSTPTSTVAAKPMATAKAANPDGRARGMKRARDNKTGKDAGDGGTAPATNPVPAVLTTVTAASTPVAMCTIATATGMAAPDSSSAAMNFADDTDDTVDGGAVGTATPTVASPRGLHGSAGTGSATELPAAPGATVATPDASTATATAVAAQMLADLTAATPNATQSALSSASTEVSSNPAAFPARTNNVSRDVSRLMRAYGSFAASSRTPATADASASDTATSNSSTESVTDLAAVPASPVAASAAQPSSEIFSATAPTPTPTNATGPDATGVTPPVAGDDVAAANIAAATASADSADIPAVAGSGRPAGTERAGRGASTSVAAKTTANSAGADRANPMAEKFAVDAVSTAAGPANSAIGSIKKTLSADSSSVTKHSSDVGTGVAKSEDLVPSVTANTPPTPAVATDHVANVAPAVSFEALTKDAAAPAASDHVSTAHYAVETALAVADQAASSGQRSVNLQFSVSGVDLSVRVELRGDAVHTTFRTDSPELRTALEHEWQEVSSDGQPSRTQRLADPVFASGSANGNAAATNTAADQRDSGARQQSATPEDSANARASARLRSADSASPATAANATPTATRVAPLQVPGRLNAFA